MKYKNSHQASIQTVFKKLERDSPFTDIESAQFSIKEQNLIRSIQLRDKEDKSNAIQTYINYQREGIKARKALASSLRHYIKKQYPKQGGQTEHEVNEFEKPKPKSKIRNNHRIETLKFVMNKDNKIKNEKTYKRVRNARVRYPNASLGELRHGVNSNWSQEYRVKHGLTRNYK